MTIKRYQIGSDIYDITPKRQTVPSNKSENCRHWYPYTCGVSGISDPCITSDIPAARADMDVNIEEPPNRGAHSRSVHVASPARFQYLQFYCHLHTNRRRCFPVRVTLKGRFQPALTIMSFNVEGLSGAKEQLIADLRHRLQCAVVCMRETHRGPDDIRPSIPGMDLAIERPHSQYGSAIFVSWDTIVNTTSLTDINNIEILRVDLNGISVTSVYKPPGERFSFHQPLTAVGDQQQVIIGDINSHSSTCG